MLFIYTQLAVKQFYFKQFSLVKVRSLNVKAVLFPTIQFSISKPFSSIYPSIDPYLVLPLWARVDLGTIAIKGYSAFPKVAALLEPHY